jgi:hypothetical protein
MQNFMQCRETYLIPLVLSMNATLRLKNQMKMIISLRPDRPEGLLRPAR